jgi:sugar lactone lactonase YvrE
METLPEQQDPRLEPFFESARVINGVTITPDGRVFVSLSGADGPGMQVAEILPCGSLIPYPDATWNARTDGGGPDGAFVGVNALRIGPDGYLWIVDSGTPAIGTPGVPGGARLIVVDTATDSIVRIHDLDDGVRENSYPDDLRFNGDRVYLTDAGMPGLMVLDTSAGTLRRLLDGHPSARDSRPMHADGTVLRTATGEELRVHADQLEVSPDGQYLYYQPASGPLSRIETRWLDDPNISPDLVASHVESWLETPTTGGTAIDADGRIYLSEPDRRRIITISPDRQVNTLVEDPRLIWSDAMWIDNLGFLWIPASQLNRTAGFSGGNESAVEYPVRIYRMPIDAMPARNDHR